MPLARTGSQWKLSPRGHKLEAKPRVLKVDVHTGEWEVFFELPQERWNVTGACWHDGHLYLMNTDTLSRIAPDKRLEDLATDLPVPVPCRIQVF